MKDGGGLCGWAVWHVLDGGRTALWLLVLLTGFPVFPARSQETRPRVAVLDFQRVDATEAEAVAAADRFRIELVKLRAFTVLERAQTDAILREQAFQQEGVTDLSRAAELGKLLNVEFVVTGRLTRLQDAHQLNVHLIHIQTGEIVRAESLVHRGEFVGMLVQEIPAAAARLSQVETAPPPPLAAVAPEAVPPMASQEARTGPMMPMIGMMGMMEMGSGGRPTWALAVGGMMVMGAAMMGSGFGGQYRDAALAMGAIGVGLVVYYLVSGDSAPAAGLGRDDPPVAQQSFSAGLWGGTVFLGAAWRW